MILLLQRMKIESDLTFILSLVLIMLAADSCGSDKKHAQKDEWANTTWYQLSSENIKLKLPNQLKESSRYRLEEDLPLLTQDSSKLRLVQNALGILEFEDSEIDVFVDTTKTYRLIIICNTQRIDFNKSDAAVLKKQIEVQNQNDAALNTELVYGNILAQMKGNQSLKLVRYTTPISNLKDTNKVYNSIYYLTGNSYSLIVYEFSSDEELVEKYLWTTMLN